MPTYDWSRSVNTTMRNYIRGAEVNVFRNRKLTGLMQRKGRITYNWPGLAMDYKVVYKRVHPTPSADGDLLIFDRKDRYKTATLDWRGYVGTDSMTKGEFLKNRGREAIIKVYSSIAENLMSDLEATFNDEFYCDGYAPGNQKRIHGVESFFANCLYTTATPSMVGSGACQPNRVYAGISTVPGYYGGTWNPGGYVAWPNGFGDEHYDFWSPVICNYNDTFFNTTDHTWPTNCVEAVSFALIKSRKVKSVRGQIDLVLMDDEMYRQYVKQQRTKEQIHILRGTESALVALGFTDVINQDGADISSEWGFNGVAYCFNVDMMELRSQQAQVFVPNGPNFNWTTRSWEFSLDFYGNISINPRFQAKILSQTI